MNLNLLNTNFGLILCALATITTTYILTRLQRSWYKKNLLRLIVVSLSVLAVVLFVINISFSSEIVPIFYLAIMLLPLSFGGCLLIALVLTKRKKKLIIIGCFSLLFSVLLSLTLVNNYFRFYPRVYDVFAIKYNAASIATNQTITLQFSSSSQPQNELNSVEGSIDAINNQSTKGTVYSIDIPGTMSKFNPRKAWVYAPAIASNPEKITLPVLVLTAGYPGVPENWLGSGLEATVNEFAKSHKGITPLIFMVDNAGSLTNDTECVNSPRGNVETYLSQDVPNFIKSHYDVKTDPNNWGIGGLSMGGMCAALIALKHPDIYRTFLDYGGEIGPEVGSKQQTVQQLFNNSVSSWEANQPQYLLAKTYKGKNMSAFYGVGKEDSRKVEEGIKTLYQLSKAAGIDSIYESISGQHTFTVWQQTFKDSFPWLSNRLGATECAVSCY